jgi:hypothetical protein
VVALVATLLAGCSASGDDSAAPPVSDPATTTSSSDPPTPASTAAQPYDTRAFAPALTVDPPAWFSSDPVQDEPHFLTWSGDGVDVDRAVRFMSPVGLYAPGAPDKKVGELRPLPRNYVHHLVGLRRHGAQIGERATTEVDGHPATLLTAGTTVSLSGVLGCQQDGLAPGACYGLQPYAVIRLAVIDDDGTTVLAWTRELPGSPTRDQDFAAFEALLATVHFR